MAAAIELVRWPLYHCWRLTFPSSMLGKRLPQDRALTFGMPPDGWFVYINKNNYLIEFFTPKSVVMSFKL
jgi:hypothetical protein